MKWLLTLLLFPVACHAQDIIYGQHSFTGPLILINEKNNATSDSCLATDSNGVVHNKLVTSGWGLTGNTGANAAVNFIGTRDNNGLSLATHDTTRIHIDSLGHVGIGVPPENYMGQVYFTTSLGGFNKIDTALGIGGQNDDLLIAEYRYGFASLRSAVGNPLILQAIDQGNGGNVGIGTSTPQATLDIAGTVRDMITTSEGDTVRFLRDSSVLGSGLRGEALQVQRPDGSLTQKFDVSNIGFSGYSPYGVSGPGWAEQSIGVNTAHYSLMICDTERLVIAFNGIGPGFATFTPTGLGIGTFTPQKNLDVQGSFNLSTNGNISGIASINYLPEGTTPAIYYKDTAHGSLAAINTEYVFSNGTPIASMSINDTVGDNFSQANLYMDEFDVFLSDSNANPTLAWQMDGDDTTILTNASVTFQDQLNPVTTTWLSPDNSSFLQIRATNISDSGIIINGNPNFTGAPTFNSSSVFNGGANFIAGAYFYGGIASLNGLGGTPLTITPGIGAGTSPSVSISGTNLGGLISITPGSTAAAGATIVTVTYNTTFANKSYPVLTPANAATALLSGSTMVYATGSTTSFIITSGATALTPSTTYSWNFVVTGN